MKDTDDYRQDMTKSKRTSQPDHSQPGLKTDLLAKEIGDRIVEARTGLGWSQQALHTRTKLNDPQEKGISRAVLSLYETGVNKPGARELVLLCESLRITPNWLLYGVETPAKTLQASMEFLRGSDLRIVVRMAFALLTIDPIDRQALSSLVLSLSEKKLGDIGLSSMMAMASLLEDSLLKEILEGADEGAKDLPVQELINLFVQRNSKGLYTNWGTNRPSIPEEDIDGFDPGIPPPPRTLSSK